MKKNLLYLFAVICSVCVFTGCSNDDEPKVTLQDLSKEYTGENLTLKLDGTALTGKTVAFAAGTAEAGTLTLTSIVPDVETITIDLALTAVAGGYTFEGSKDLTGYVVSVNGTLTNDSKLTVNVITKGWESLEKTEYTAESLALKINGEAVAGQAVSFNVVSNTEANLVLKNVFEGVTEDFTVPVKMTITKAAASVQSYAFAGADSSKVGYIVLASGTVATDGKLTLDVETGGWKTFAESYSYKAKNLTFAGGATSDDEKNSSTRTIEVVVDPASDGTKASLVFNKDFLSDLKIMDLDTMDVTLTREGTQYKISGEKAYTDFLVFVAEGFVTADKLDLTVTTPKYTQLKNDIMGVWKVKQTAGVANVTFNLVTSTGSITLPDAIANLIPNTPEVSQYIGTPIPDATINGLVNTLLGQYALQLNSIEFTNTEKNGYKDIIVTYTAVNTTTPVELKGLLHYNWSKDGLYIGFDITKLMEVATPQQRSAIRIDLLGDGILLDCDITDGVLNLSIDKEIVSAIVKYIQTLLPTIKSLLATPEYLPMVGIPAEAAVVLNQIVPLLDAVLPEIQKILGDVTTFNVGIKFAK